MSEMLNKASGALAGVALGDALGMPSELWVPQRVKAEFGWIDRFLDAPAGHEIVDGFKAGQVTDDTQQTFMLAQALVDHGRELSAEDMAAALVAWADRVGATEGSFLGPSSAKAIDLLKTGADPRTTGSAGETNGAAMRIVPVGIVCSSKYPADLVDMVQEVSLMSHNTGVAISGACLVAGIVSAALDGADVDQAVAFGTAVAEEGRARGVQTVAASVAARAKLAVELARSEAADAEFLESLYDQVGAWVTTTESVAAAVGILVRAKADPVTAAVLSANLGGDTDTIGAMSTGMAGAFAGIDAIPPETVDQLSDTNGIAPQAMARQLLRLRK